MITQQLTQLIQFLVNQLGYEIKKIKPPYAARATNLPTPYIEREEFGASNLEVKLERLKSGGSFEHPDIINLNEAVVLLLGSDKRIVELGCGTGKFASKAAQDLSRIVVASEFDRSTYDWCLHNIPPRENLTFVNGPILQESGYFNVSVSIEVIEHIADFVEFLKEMRRLAPRSLITTPNRKRSKSDYHAGPPAYFQHVREWTAGEFYWVLRCFWDDVELYGMISHTIPEFVQVDIDTCLSPLIADCRLPKN